MLFSTWNLYRIADTNVHYKIANVDVGQVPLKKEGPKTHHFPQLNVCDFVEEIPRGMPNEYPRYSSCFMVFMTKDDQRAFASDSSPRFLCPRWPTQSPCGKTSGAKPWENHGNIWGKSSSMELDGRIKLLQPRCTPVTTCCRTVGESKPWPIWDLHKRHVWPTSYTIPISHNILYISIHIVQALK